MDDLRPAAATGHLFLRAADVGSGAERLAAVGIRVVMKREAIAILELRGGTHIVLRPLRESGLHEAPFDLMYDNVDDACASFERAGFAVTEIEKGAIHRAFTATAPERFSVRVLDTHAGNRVV